jgi:hypothetical protein
MKRSDIKLLIQPGHFASDEDWGHFVESWVTDHRGIKVVVPDFQRCRVWTREQQTAYIENMLRGYPSGRDVYYNHPTWGSFEDAEKYPLEIIDGQQRINTVVAFLNNEFPIFGNTYYKDFEGGLDYSTASFKVHVLNMKTRREVIEWYIAFNAGGTVHTSDELDRVRKLLEKETTA